MPISKPSCERFVAAAAGDAGGWLVVVAAIDEQQGDTPTHLPGDAGAPLQVSVRQHRRSPSISPIRCRLHRIDQLSAQQIPRRTVVKLDVVKRVRNDLGQPDQPGLHVLDEEQVNGAEQQPAEADPSQTLAM